MTRGIDHTACCAMGYVPLPQIVGSDRRREPGSSYDDAQIFQKDAHVDECCERHCLLAGNVCRVRVSVC
jgi:hypothetical protein